MLISSCGRKIETAVRYMVNTVSGCHTYLQGNQLLQACEINDVSTRYRT